MKQALTTSRTERERDGLDKLDRLEKVGYDRKFVFLTLSLDERKQNPWCRYIYYVELDFWISLVILVITRELES